MGTGEGPLGGAPQLQLVARAVAAPAGAPVGVVVVAVGAWGIALVLVLALALHMLHMLGGRAAYPHPEVGGCAQGSAWAAIQAEAYAGA